MQISQAGATICVLPSVLSAVSVADPEAAWVVVLLASGEPALENRASVRSRFELTPGARGLPGLETKHAYGRRARNAHFLQRDFRPVAHRAAPTSANRITTHGASGLSSYLMSSDQVEGVWGPSTDNDVVMPPSEQATLRGV